MHALVNFRFRKNLHAMSAKEGRGHTGAGMFFAFKGPVINMAAAAGGAGVRQNGKLAVMVLSECKSDSGSRQKLGCNICPGYILHARGVCQHVGSGLAVCDFRRGAWCTEPGGDFRADYHKLASLLPDSQSGMQTVFAEPL